MALDTKKILGTIKFEIEVYRAFQAPNGFLTSDIACHALFYYYLKGVNVYLRHEKDFLEYEGEVTTPPNYHQLFESVAMMYGVEPCEMSKFWSAVDLQADLMGFTRMPEGANYRHDDQKILLN